ncbi:MAG: cobalamin B12-binding domain-containing protein [Candidatus Omnitrophica bacterium]|nr:cobalamin B12-binding domain-containing protein [Candidatus Omnitrophota bacterium]
MRSVIYLADLTHTGPVISSNVHPLAAGLVGAYVVERCPNRIEVELFKYPQDLSAAMARRRPRLVGFSNYSWTCNLSYEYARQIKHAYPEIVIVFGGPNYGLREQEMLAFWQRYPLIDFYLVKEGELPMVELLHGLEDCGYDPAALKRSGRSLPNCHYQWQGTLVTGEILPRLTELEQLPSPYLMGLMDKFFDGVLSPMIHTTRGCPFTCTFCSEGATYYNKVAQRVGIAEELDYIAQRVGSVPDLYLTDANFGMYQQDREKAKIISSIQQRYGWPKRLVVSTGKNQKERVIEVASMLNGSLNVAASLQSTDPTVLQNIQRANISLDALNVMAKQTTETGADTYTELILGLPGDSKQAHTKSLRDVVEADLGIVRMYQLIMLPQTELNTPETRQRYAMKTRFRIMPRSFGRYDLLGKAILAVESEEICVENSTLTFEDYLECRELNLTVEILHNGRVFVELQGLCKWLGCSWFDFLLRVHQQRRSSHEALRRFYETFREETTKRLWATREELEGYVSQHLDELLGHEESTNEMATSKAIAFFQLQGTLHDVLFEEMTALLNERGCLDEVMGVYIRELRDYSQCRKARLTEGREYHGRFHFDFPGIGEHHYAVDPRDYFLEGRTVELRFCHSARQREMIQGYLRQYGNTLDGMGRILMRVWPTTRLFREVLCQEEHALAAA